MSSNVDRLCAKKGCDNVGKHLCSGCGEEIYCSKECQKAHWAEHKPSCKSAVKPESAALLKSLDSLSIKQLKNVMKAKAATFDNKKKTIVLTKLESIVEKPNLVKFVQEHVNISEVEGLLSSSPGSDVSSSSSSSIKSKQNKAAAAAAAAAAANPALPSPTQLRQQAKMMREQPNAVRKANAMFANMTDAQIRQYADQIEQVRGSVIFSLVLSCYIILVFSLYSLFICNGLDVKFVPTMYFLTIILIVSTLFFVLCRLRRTLRCCRRWLRWPR